MIKRLCVVLAALAIMLCLSVPAAAEWVWQPFSFTTSQAFDPPVMVRAMENPTAGRVSSNYEMLRLYLVDGSVVYLRTVGQVQSSAPASYQLYFIDGARYYWYSEAYGQYMKGWNRFTGGQIFASSAPRALEVQSVDVSDFGQSDKLLEVMVWQESPTEPPTEPPPEPGSENWLVLFNMLDEVFDFWWDFKFWGIPVYQAMLGIMVVGIILSVFLIVARSKTDG